MIEEVVIVCDRCGTKVRGQRGCVLDGCGWWTSGYYDLSDSYWGQFALNDKEKKICDECMLADLRYHSR